MNPTQIIHFPNHNNVGIILPAASGDHKSTIIFLHGLGDNGYSWAMALRGMRAMLPDTKIICPTAPTASVTLNRGHASTSWHDLSSLDEIDSEEKNTFKGVEENVAMLQELLQSELDAGVSTIALGGFSQGAAMSLLAGYTFDKPLAGIAALSGYAVKRSLLKLSDANKQTPGLIMHGTADAVVPFGAGKSVHAHLRELGAPVEFASFDNLGHSTSPAELHQLLAFFQKTLGYISKEE
jgi:predicted esterase